MRATNKTQPMFDASLISWSAFAVVMAPALITLDLDGYVVGFAAVTRGPARRSRPLPAPPVPRLRDLGHLVRAIAPTVPAAGLVLIARLIGPVDRVLPLAIGELALYVAATLPSPCCSSTSAARGRRLRVLPRRQAARPGAGSGLGGHPLHERHLEHLLVHDGPWPKSRPRRTARRGRR